jgi:hypothetical protein
LLAIVAVTSTYGDNPFFKVGRQGRSVIAVFGQLSVCVFLITGGMLVLVWLMDRFGDRP